MSHHPNHPIGGSHPRQHLVGILDYGIIALLDYRREGSNVRDVVLAYMLDRELLSEGI